MIRNDKIAQAIEQLSHRRSPERRRAAKNLRNAAARSAGPALLEALRKEVRDARTWETQYQMIMALGEAGYREALPFLKELAETSEDPAMVSVGLGDAIARLSRNGENDISPVLERIRDSANSSLIDGALRAMAMLQIVPGDAAIEEIVGFASRFPPADPMRFWVAAAAAGWRGPQVQNFLKGCEQSGREDLKKAATNSLAGKYKNWRPL